MVKVMISSEPLMAVSVAENAAAGVCTSLSVSKVEAVADPGAET
jgi:hypothetical protein